MPLYDVQTTFAGSISNNVVSGQAVNTAAAGTYNGNFTYDLWGGQSAAPTDALGNTLNLDTGLGKEVKVAISIVTAFTGVGASVQFVLTESDDAAQTTNVVIVQEGRVWAIGSLGATGLIERLVVPINMGKRYLGVQYIVTGAALTAGAFFAGIVIDEGSSLPIV